jgi:hypothetical protein
MASALGDENARIPVTHAVRLAEGQSDGQFIARHDTDGHYLPIQEAIMNDMVFQTGGDWSNTTLYCNGEEVMAAELFVELQAGRDEWGNPASGGVLDGADLTAFVRPQDDPDNPADILPGRITLNFPDHSIILENMHPLVEVDMTRVWYNGEDVTNRVVDVYVDVNAVDNVVKAFITVYKPHWIAADEVITYSIFG